MKKIFYLALIAVIAIVSVKLMNGSAGDLSLANLLSIDSGKSNAPVSANLAHQKVGKKLNSSVLSRLDGQRFASASIKKKPECYLLYFSASW